MLNYIEQINMFWKLDAEHSFNGNESRLYFYLLSLSNSLYWKNPLTNADGYTASRVGISVNTLKAVRNRLQQAGLITFKPGGNGARNKCQYYLVPEAQVMRELSNKVSNSDTLLNETLTPYLIPGMQKTDDINKHKLNQTKQVVAPATPAPPKKKVLKKKEKKLDEKEAEPFWQSLMDVWFDVYKSVHQGEEPSMDGRHPKLFKELVEKLKKRAARKNYEWNATNSVESLKYFLGRAISDEWMKSHLSLKNLVEQFDIVYQDKQKPGAKKEPEKVHVQTGPKSFNDTMGYIFGRYCEPDFDIAIILPEYYDKLVSNGELKVGTMARFEGTHDQQKVQAVLAFLETKRNQLKQVNA